MMMTSTYSQHRFATLAAQRLPSSPRLWSLLEVACHQLDLELSKCTTPLAVDRRAFTENAEVVRTLARLKEETK